MKSLHIRNLEDDVLCGLKRRAARHRRSLQKEVESVLADAARMVPVDEAPHPERKLNLRTVHSGNPNADWSRERLYGDDGR